MLLPAIVAMLACITLTTPATAATRQEDWTPEMCRGPNTPALWLNNKPLVEWCYSHGYTEPHNRQSVGGHPRATSALVFDVTPGTILPPNDDEFFGPYDFPSPLRVFGEDKRRFWISNNGLISFTYGVSAYTPTGFQEVDQAMIAAYWGDVDTTGTCPATAPQCNKVIWRLSTPTENPGDLVTAKNFLGTATLPDYVLIITWYQVGYYFEATDKLNTFQMFVAKFGEKTYAGFFYDQLQWTAGDASGGENGLYVPGNDGAAAYAGFGNGSPDTLIYYNLRGSGTNAVLGLTSLTGGTWNRPISALRAGQPGQWVWDTIADTGCAAFVPGAKQCGAACLPPDQCCAAPNDCPYGQCPATGGTCPTPPSPSPSPSPSNPCDGQPDGTSCPWPKSYAMSVGTPSAGHKEVSPSEVSDLANKANLLKAKWPQCQSLCLSGTCVVTSGTGAKCCYVKKHYKYADTEDTSSLAYWHARKWWCLD